MPHNGNLYLADVLNFRVRKIDASGNITSIAGSGNFGRIDENAPAVNSVMLPAGVAFDGFGGLYLSDVNRNLVRRVDLSSGLIKTIAGNGSMGFAGDNGGALQAELSNPDGLAVDPVRGITFIADFSNARIRKISGGIISTFAGTDIHDGGAATSAFLNFPQGIAAVGATQVVVADSGNSVARRFTPGSTIGTFGQVNGVPVAATADQAGNVYITDDEPLVLKVTPSGVTTIVAGNGTEGYTGDNGPAVSAAISEPTGVAIDPGGNVYFTDFFNNRIRKVTAATGVIATIAGNGKFQFSGDNGPALSAGLDPFDVAVDGRSNIFIADRVNNRVRKISSDGMISTFAGTGAAGYSGDGGPALAATLNFPTGIALDIAGNLYIADNGNSVVRRVTASGLITTIAGSGVNMPSSGDGGPAIAAQLDPWRVSVDGSGSVYVTDSLNDRVRKLTPKAMTPIAIKIVSGNNQSGSAGMQLTMPLTIRITDSTGAGVPGVVITFTVNPAGAAVVDLPNAITLNDGTVTTKATLGASAGPITIAVASPGLTGASFSLTAVPAISPTAPVTASGGMIGAGLSIPPVRAFSPNGIATIFGQNFAPDGTARQVSAEDLVDGKIPTTLAGACVEVGARRAPIFGVYPGQLNIQVPQLPPGNTTVQVINKCGTPLEERSGLAPVMLLAASPEFFYFQNNADGRNPVAAVNAVTGAYVGASAPARPGDILTLYATGFGATEPSFGPGELPNAAAQITGAASVSMGSVPLDPANILYAGVTQNAGLYQLNVRVPAGVPNGNQAVVITIAGVASPSGAYIAIQN